jgi:hypothetical protein
MAANTAAWLEGRAIAQPTSGRRERVDVPSFASLPRPTVPDPDPGALAFSTAAVTMLTPRRARTGGGLKEAALADEQHVPPEGGERAPRPPAPTSGKDRSQAIIELYRPHFPRRPVQEMRQIMSNYPGQDEPKPKQLPPQTQFQPPPQPQPQPQPPPQPQAQAWQNLAPAKVPEPAQKTAPVGGGSSGVILDAAGAATGTAAGTGATATARARAAASASAAARAGGVTSAAGTRTRSPGRDCAATTYVDPHSRA